MYNIITKERLYAAKPDNVRRLASWLKLDIYELSIDEVIDLVYNRIFYDKYLGIK